MERFLEEDDVSELEGKTYVTLEGLDYNGKYYIFVNRILGEDIPTKEYKMLECLEDGVSEIEDIEVAKKVAELFGGKLKVKVDNIKDIMQDKGSE